MTAVVLSLSGFHGVSAIVALASASADLIDYRNIDEELSPAYKRVKQLKFWISSAYFLKACWSTAAAIAAANEEDYKLSRRGFTFRDVFSFTVREAVLSLPRQLVWIEVLWHVYEAIGHVLLDDAVIGTWLHSAMSVWGVTVLLTDN